ncbi:MAG: histidinol dehydrogenase [Fibrobacterota bacterium]
MNIPILDISSDAGRAEYRRIQDARQQRDDAVEERVKEIFRQIEDRGNTALFEYCERFDQRVLTADTLRLSGAYIAGQAEKIAPDLAETIDAAAERIEAYHRRQLIDRSFEMTTAEGVLSQRILPLSRAALYVPGGYTVYPSTVLMNGIPAKLAGVEEIVALTPCRGGDIAPEIAYVLQKLSITEVYQMGGAHGVAALALGTETVQSVDKIVGPGNAYVAAAKKRAYGAVDIDSIAGPSEIAILADATADPSWLALDLLSQAEHGSGDETAVCVTEDWAFADRVHAALTAEIAASPVQKVFEKLSAGAIIIACADTRAGAIDFVNALGPEHLEIVTEDPDEDCAQIRNAAAIFLGPYTPVPLGDYFVGTNHVLPTGGASRYASPLGVDDFLKRVSVAKISREGLAACAPHLSRFARAEKFVHHAMAVERRAGYTPEDV